MVCRISATCPGPSPRRRSTRSKSERRIICPSVWSPRSMTRARLTARRTSPRQPRVSARECAMCSAQRTHGLSGAGCLRRSLRPYRKRGAAGRTAVAATSSGEDARRAAVEACGGCPWRRCPPRSGGSAVCRPGRGAWACRRRTAGGAGRGARPAAARCRCRRRRPAARICPAGPGTSTAGSVPSSAAAGAGTSRTRRPATGRGTPSKDGTAPPHAAVPRRCRQRRRLARGRGRTGSSRVVRPAAATGRHGGGARRPWRPARPRRPAAARRCRGG